MRKAKADTPANNKFREIVAKKIEALDMAILALSDYDKLMTINQQLAFENEELRENRDGWIPVEEKLPEKSGRVYVTVDYDRTKYVTTAIYDKTIQKFIQGFCDPVEHVTAWREDIEPYKADKEE